MKKIHYLIFSFFALGCNSKLENSNSIAVKPTINIKKKKSNGTEIVNKLEKLNFFNLTEKSDLNDEKEELARAYNENNFFEGALRGETLEFLDNRFYFIDSEELFKVGGLINYLKTVKPVFEKLDLKLNYSNEKSFQNEKHWRHTIELNSREYIAFDNNFSKQDWNIAYVMFIEMLNEELEIQNSEERFYPISSQNDGRMVLLTKKQFEFIKENYPNDKEHPKELAVWKKENNLY